MPRQIACRILNHGGLGVEGLSVQHALIHGEVVARHRLDTEVLLHVGMAGARVMATCIAIGQAAGTAAALAVDADVPVGALDVQALRAALRADGQLV